MREGYIKLWRQSLESESWQNIKQWRFWTWCLLKATYCESDVVVGKQTIHLMPGQFVTGRFAAMKETGLSEQEIRNQQINHQINQQITIKSTNKYSIITIVNWAEYQGESTNKTTSKPTDKQPANQPHTRSIKNNKEVKNIYGEFQNILLSSKEYDKLVVKFGEPLALQKIEELSIALASNKQYQKKYSSHYATILAWDRRKNPTAARSEIKAGDYIKEEL